MNIVVVSDYGWPTGGTEEFVRGFLASSRARGLNTGLLTWESARAPVPEAISVTRIDNGDVLAIWDAVSRADLVVVITSFNMRLLARVATEVIQRSGVPAMTVVQTSAHSTPGAAASDLQRGWLKELVETSTVVVGASAAVVHGLDELGLSGKAEIVEIENGARLVGTSSRQRGRREVLFIGRPTESKGYPTYLQLVEALSGIGLSFSANTVSIPADVVDSRISYSNCLPDQELLELFAGADLVVAPYWRADGSPLAVLEAINCGVPVMGFDSPAVGPLLRRHKQFVVDRDPKRLIDSVRQWQRGELNVAPATAGAVPSLARQVDQYFDLIESIMGTNKRSRHGREARSQPAF